MAPIRIRFLPLAAVAYFAFAAVFAAIAGAPLWAAGQRMFLALNLVVAVGVGVAGGYLRRRDDGGGGGGGIRGVRRPPGRYSRASIRRTPRRPRRGSPR